MANTLKITLDHAQRRLKTLANTISMLGTELLDNQDDLDCMLLPVVNAVALKPYQLDLSWFTSNSGEYLKYTKASGYEVNTSGKWTEPVNFTGAGTYLRCDDSASEYARTSTAPGLNRPMFLSWHLFSSQDVFLAIQCGWSDSTTPSAQTASIGLEIYSDGEVRIYKDGVRQSSRQCNYRVDVTANNLCHMVLWPCRRRELLIFTQRVGVTTAGPIPTAIQNGGGFVHVFDDIDEDEDAPEITPAEKFFVTSGGAGNIMCQFHPLTFAVSGDALSMTWQFGTPPKVGAAFFDTWVNPKFPLITNASVYGDTAFAGTTGVSSVALRNEGDSGDFAPDGVTKAARSKIVLSSDGSYSPFIYGIIFQYKATTTVTNSSQEFDLTPFFTVCGIEVPDDPFGAVAHVEAIIGLETVVSDVEIVRYLDIEVANIESQSNRPVKLSLDDQVPFLDGLLRRPHYKDGIIEQVKRLAFDVEGVEALIGEHVFRTKMPFDGFALCCPPSYGVSVIGKILEEAGWDLERTNLSYVYKAGTTDLFIVGEIPAQGCEEWNFAAEVGDTVKSVLEQAFRYASDCTYGFHPGLMGTEFWFLTPEDLPTEPAVELYFDMETAEAANPGLTSEECSELLYDGFDDSTQASEAVEVRATGMDPRTGNIMQAFAIDEDAANPELAPNLRPENWLGAFPPVGVSSRQFRQEADLDRTVEGLLPVATQQATTGQFNANTILFYRHPDTSPEDPVYLPVWRMDMVSLDGIGSDKRISSISGQFIKEVGDDDRVDSFHIRSCRYTTGSIRGKGGTTVAEIQAVKRARAASPFITDLEQAKIMSGMFLVSG